jgi:hypothetical protein
MNTQQSTRQWRALFRRRRVLAVGLTAAALAALGLMSMQAEAPQGDREEELRKLGFHEPKSSAKPGQSASPAGEGDSRARAHTAPDRAASADETLPEDGGSADDARDLVADSLEGLPALSLKLALLEKGHEQLSQSPGYSATFYKKERVNGKLLDDQVMEVKLRHDPFSVYMKWLVGDKGRELIYVDGRNKGKTVLHMGGWKARLLPPLKLDPEGSFAMEESRHSITGFGMKNLSQKLIDYRRRDLRQNGQGVSCRMINKQVCNDRDCYNFIIEYDGPEYSETYRKSVVFIDQEWLVPICIRNYAWPPDSLQRSDPQQLDEATLIEWYSYSNVDFDAAFTDADFDHTNEDYQFRN